MQTTTTRRTILAGLAAAPVVGLPALAADSLPADPIFAAIDAHKAAQKRFLVHCDQLDEAAYEVASCAERDALESLIATVPATIAGARAAMEWLVKYDDGCVPEISGRFVETLLRSPILLEAQQ